MANRSFYDIVMVGDFRFPGGAASGPGEQIRAQAKAGYRTGLIQIKGPVLGYPHPFNPTVRKCVDEGLADLLDPRDSISASLLLAYHPQIFTYPPSHSFSIDAETRLFIISHPLLDGEGNPYYDWNTINNNAQEVFGPDMLWAPLGPLVRAPVAGLENPPPLFEHDWLEVLDIDDWAATRHGFCDNRPVIGRHSRPDFLKWPDDRETTLAAYPDDPACRVRVLGGAPFLKDLVGDYPANWEVLPFNSVDPKEFLRTIDFFVYFHHSRWVEAFGRVIIEAMASGALAILPPMFEVLFGEAAIYGEPKDVKSLVSEYYGDWSAFAEQKGRTAEILRQRFSHTAHVDRVRKLVGPPRKVQVTTSTAPKPPPVRAIFMTSNGIGMGHLTRTLAIARRCCPAIQPIFVTMSQALKVIQEHNFLAEYIPFHSYLKCDNNRWNHFLRQQLNEIISYYNASVLVFDGNVAYGGLTSSLRDNPKCLSLWCRRAMWRPGTAAEDIIKRESEFHGVVEPGELANSYDHGLTTKYRSRTRLVDPIRLLDQNELMDRQLAREHLGIDPDKTAVLLQLGSGNNFDYSKVRSLVLSRLLREKDLQIAVAQWMISNEDLELPPEVIRLSLYPLGKYLRAFDFVISAAGYNGFHELLATGVPTIFIPNEEPSMDEQLSRAQYAEHKSLALCIRARELYKVDPYLDMILEPGFREDITARCASLPQANGAHEAAEFVHELTFTARADREPRRFWRSRHA